MLECDYRNEDTPILPGELTFSEEETRSRYCADAVARLAEFFSPMKKGRLDLIYIRHCNKTVRCYSAVCLKCASAQQRMACEMIDVQWPKSVSLSHVIIRRPDAAIERGSLSVFVAYGERSWLHEELAKAKADDFEYRGYVDVERLYSAEPNDAPWMPVIHLVTSTENVQTIHDVISSSTSGGPMAGVTSRLLDRSSRDDLLAVFPTMPSCVSAQPAFSTCSVRTHEWTIAVDQLDAFGWLIEQPLGVLHFSSGDQDA